MRQITSFTFLSLDGRYAGPQGDIGWHQHGAEGTALSEQSLRSGNTLLFGRKTFLMMQGFWPTPAASAMFPAVAAGMNGAHKMVFSRTLTKTIWPNTTLMKSDAVRSLRAMKKSAGDNLTVLGSGSLVTSLAQAGLIDEYQILLDPIALGKGVPLFNGLTRPLALTLVSSRPFTSGQVLLTYRPAGSQSS
jgi:dihydrofolate reductase